MMILIFFPVYSQTSIAFRITVIQGFWNAKCLPYHIDKTSGNSVNYGKIVKNMEKMIIKR